MRYRLMASYQDAPFEAGIGPTDQDVVLFAACPPPEELGFEPATGHWRKQLRLPDVQAVWESRPVGMFRGERCTVLDDLGDRLHIGYLGHDGYQAEQLGYWQVDRGVFELVAPRSEVTGIVEERVEHVRSAPPSRAPRGVPPVLQAAWPTAPAADEPSPWRRQREPAPQETSQPLTPQPAGRGEPARWSDAPTGLPAAERDWTTPPQPGPPDAERWSSSAEVSDSGEVPLPAAYRLAPDEVTGVALPPSAAEPLPLEAQAMRAASAARWTRPGSAEQGRTESRSAEPTSTQPANAQQARTQSAAPGRTALLEGMPAAPPERQRLASERLFADLADQAGIPAHRYSIGAEVDGAFCLIPAGDGFEVFRSVSGTRREPHTFATEETACFYLFGVLAADAIRTGALTRRTAR